APAGFRGLTDRAELWVPFMISGSDLQNRGNRGFVALARLKPGVSVRRAQVEMDAISNRLAAAYPATNSARGVEVSPLVTEIFGDLQKPLLILLAAVGFVLLIAATNVANLLLARAEARQQEIAMRTALGASRSRLARQLLAESAILVAFGCAGGLAAAFYGIRLLMAATPLKFPSFVNPSINASVALFTILLCAAVTLALGLAPAWQIGPGVASGSRSTGSRHASRFRGALIVTEISVSLVLLVGAGLMIRSLNHLAAIHPGYDPNHIVHLRVDIPQVEGAKLTVAAGEILRDVAALPSVQSASVSNDAPLAESSATFYAAEGQPPTDAHNQPRAYFHRVSPDFFSTLHTRFLDGRTFSADEVRQNANVAIVTENLVHRFWPGQDPIGKRVKVGSLNSNRPWLTIVGVVENLKYRGLPENPTADPDLFQIFNERTLDFAVLVRTSLDPSTMISSIRGALHQSAPSILIYNAGTLDQLVSDQTSLPRFLGWLMSIFAAIALLLAIIGIYGVISYGVSRQTREIGVRMALGATRGDVIGRILGRGMALVIAGVILGSLASLALTRLMATVIFGVRSTDPLTFAAAAALLTMVAAAACLAPAARASRIDPLAALRDA
ncbi:MAG TPA: ADOP family duplicated permease, partial [Bryobacteraceae bacterium]|nr:ADOP family duplicated permease [Bryobacteraceae bacterium]